MREGAGYGPFSSHNPLRGSDPTSEAECRVENVQVVKTRVAQHRFGFAQRMKVKAVVHHGCPFGCFAALDSRTLAERD